MHRLLATVACVAAVVATLLVSSPAQAASYGVSTSLSAVKADVGQSVRISGSVSGAGAAGKTVTVQRKVGSGPWVSIGTARTNSRRAFVFTHRVSAVGAQQFRVVAPRSGGTAQGVGPARAFTGWTWLWLDEQPHQVFGSTKFGRTYPALGGRWTATHSIALGTTNDTTGIAWRLDGACDQAELFVSRLDTAPVTVAATAFNGFGQPETVDSRQPETLLADGYDVYLMDGIQAGNPGTERLNVDRSGNGEAVLLSPRVHCRVAALAAPFGV